MAENSVSVELTIETIDALKQIAKTQTAISNLAKNSAKDLEKTESAFGSLGTTIAGVFGGNLLTKAFDVVVSALNEIPGAIVGITHAGIEAEESTKKLALALAQSGDASEGTLKSFEELATKLSQLIGVEDEVVAGSLRLALQFGATREQAKQIAIAAADVAASGLIPFEDAVQQLAGTLNGVAPRAFARSVEGIKGLSEESLKSGDAIDIVAKRFRDFAAINSSNLSVQIANVGVNFGELEEAIGKVVAKNGTVKALFTTINDALKQIGEEINKNGPAIDKFASDFVLFGVVTFQTLTQIVDGVIRFGAIVFDIFNGAGELVNVFVGILKDLTVGIAELAIKLSTLDFSKPFSGFESTIASFEKFKQVGDDLNKSLDTSQAFTSAGRAVDDFTNKFINNYALQTTAVETKNQALTESVAISQGISAEEIARQQQIVIDIAALKDQEATNDIARQQLLDESIFTSAQTLAENKNIIAQREIQDRFNAEEAKILLIKNANERELALIKNTQARKNAVDKQTTAFEEQNQKTRTENLKGTLSTISSLQSSNVKELFVIGKAAALATATIDGIQAVQKALASAPPPFNFVLAGLVGAVQAINLGKIASAQPPKFAEGGIVPGNSFSGDKVTARLNSGEVVLNKSQQKELLNIANGDGGGNLEAAIDRLGNRIANMNFVVQANAREIARLVRDEREAGFA